MANINITIPDELHKKLKIDAALSEKTQKELIITYLQDYFSKHA